MLPLLPYDIVERIISFTNIGYICLTLWTVGRHLEYNDKKRLLYHRTSPINYLSRFTDKPLYLLQIMRRTKTVLSGLRAADYFSPGIATDTSSWDFYCPNIRDNVAELLSTLECIGYKFIISCKDISYNSYSSSRSYVVNGQKQNIKVRVIISNDSTMITTILKHHCSITQCIISGYCAISLYHILWKNSKGVYWPSNIMKRNDYYSSFTILNTQNVENLQNIHDISDVSKMLSKSIINEYKNYNIELNNYSNYYNIFKDLPSNDSKTSTLRSIYDSKSFVLNFKFKGLVSSNWKDYLLCFIWKQDSEGITIRGDINTLRDSDNLPIYNTINNISTVKSKRKEKLDELIISSETKNWIGSNIELSRYKFINDYPF